MRRRRGRGQVAGLALGFPAGHIPRHRCPMAAARARSAALMGAAWWAWTIAVVVLGGVACGALTVGAVYVLVLVLTGQDLSQWAMTR